MSLNIENIEHIFGSKPVLHHISLEVQAGEVLCLLGPSGCGKTTLLRLIAGLEEVQTGCIRIGNRVVAERGRHLPPEERGIGFVFQDLALFPHLTVLENTLFGLMTIREKEHRRAKALNALHRVGMDGFAGVYPHELSGGQQQRVALARALAPGPRIVLLDEPFSSLDARLRVQIRDETLHVLKESGVATVMVTHDPEEAMFMGDRIVLLREGKIVQTGSPVDLYARPATPFVATFFSEVNEIRSRVSEGQVQTVLGSMEARGLADGTEVTLMFRPDSVQVSTHCTGADGPGVPARVLARRLLPGATLVHLQVHANGEGGRDLHVHARIPCIASLAEGVDVSVLVPEEAIHVFCEPNETP